MYDGKIAAIVDPKQTTEQELGLLMAGSSLEKARAALQAEEEEKKEAELIES